jgi:hypothetical protein
MEVAPFDFQIFRRARDIPVMLTQFSRDVVLFERIPGVPERVVRLREEWINCGSRSRSLECGPNRTRLQLVPPQ